MPHNPPGAQLAAALLALDLVPPATRLENSDSFFFTCWLSQLGQATSLTALALRTNLSKDVPQLGQSNS